MYVAQRELKVVPRGIETKEFKIYRPGDEIPDFEDWDVVIQKAHLNLEYVVKVDDANKKPAVAPKAVKHEVAAGIELTCNLCPGKQFKSAKALKTHTTLAHKK